MVQAALCTQQDVMDHLASGDGFSNFGSYGDVIDTAISVASSMIRTHVRQTLDRGLKACVFGTRSNTFGEPQRFSLNERFIDKNTLAVVYDDVAPAVDLSSNDPLVLNKDYFIESVGDHGPHAVVLVIPTSAHKRSLKVSFMTGFSADNNGLLVGLPDEIRRASVLHASYLCSLLFGRAGDRAAGSMSNSAVIAEQMMRKQLVPEAAGLLSQYRVVLVGRS